MNEKLVSQFRMRAAALAVASCASLAPGLADAASLGRITVLSNLGQPLRAEVQVGATRDELAGMTVRLAPGESFRQAGVHYAPVLQDLRFTLDKGPDGNPVVRVTSTRPVNETFLDFLLELNWPSGRLVREYTVLLDPPELAGRSAGKPVSVAEAKPVEAVRGGSDPEPVEPAEPAAEEIPARTEAGKARTAPGAGERVAKADSGSRQVKRGDTLRRIAEETRYEGVSLEQMLVGLYRANSDAFMGGNINRMKSGAILDLPDKDAVAEIPQAEARKIFRAHASDWNTYRKNLAAAAAQGPAREEAGSQSAGGRITARVDEKPSPVDTQKDQVRVSRAEAADKGLPGDPAKPRAEENLIAKEKALQEAQERLAILEKNVADLQKLLEMKNQSLAELQKQAASKPEVPPAAPVEPPRAAESAKAAEPAVAPKPAEPEKPAVAEKPAEAATPAAVAPQAEPPRKPIAMLGEEEEPETSFMEDLAANPLTLAGAGGILALLAAYALHRRRRNPPAGLSTLAPTTTSLESAPVYGAAGGQKVDTGDSAPLHTDFSQTGPGTIDTDEVDPVAEAEVYMAYGRDTQAEEILLEALQKDPQRTAIHVKLLEIYSGRNSIQQFDGMAEELHARTSGSGPDWEKAVAMGILLNPANPLYAAGKEAPATAEEKLAPRETAPVATDEPLDFEPAPSAGGLTPPVEEFAIEALDVVPPGEPEPLLMDEAPAEALAGLDFDLDAPSPALAETEAAGKPEAALDADLDFDLGIGQPPGGDVLADSEPALEESGAEKPFNFDFNLDLASSAVAPLSDPDPEPVSPGAIGAGRDLPDEPAVEESIDMDAGALDFDLDMAAGEVTETPVEMSSLDLASIDLDLAGEPGQDASPEAGEPAPREAPPVRDAAWEEINTKLDLAKAYEEMGDLEGARELLQEVLGEGPDDLVQEAHGILDRINA